MAKSYLLKLGPELRIIPSKVVDAFQLNEALVIGLACFHEQREQLIRDAAIGDKYYRGRKVVDALEVTLSKLEEKFPQINQQIRHLAFGGEVVLN